MVKLEKKIAYTLMYLGMGLMLSSLGLLYFVIWSSAHLGQITATGVLNFLLGVLSFFSGGIWKDEIEKRERRNRV